MRLFKTKQKERTQSDYGKHPNDFEHRCKWRDQIADIGDGTKNGSGEDVIVDMQSGKQARYKLFSEDADSITADSTGLRHWRYHFIDYVLPSEDSRG